MGKKFNLWLSHVLVIQILFSSFYAHAGIGKCQASFYEADFISRINKAFEKTSEEKLRTEDPEARVDDATESAPNSSERFVEVLRVIDLELQSFDINTDKEKLTLLAKQVALVTDLRDVQLEGFRKAFLSEPEFSANKKSLQFFFMRLAEHKAHQLHPVEGEITEFQDFFLKQEKSLLWKLMWPFMAPRLLNESGTKGFAWSSAKVSIISSAFVVVGLRMVKDLPVFSFDTVMDYTLLSVTYQFWNYQRNFILRSNKLSSRMKEFYQWYYNIFWYGSIMAMTETVRAITSPNTGDVDAATYTAYLAVFLLLWPATVSKINKAFMWHLSEFLPPKVMPHESRNNDSAEEFALALNPEKSYDEVAKFFQEKLQFHQLSLELIYKLVNKEPGFMSRLSTKAKTNLVRFYTGNKNITAEPTLDPYTQLAYPGIVSIHDRFTDYNGLYLKEGQIKKQLDRFINDLKFGEILEDGTEFPTELRKMAVEIIKGVTGFDGTKDGMIHSAHGIKMQIAFHKIKIFHYKAMLLFWLPRFRKGFNPHLNEPEASENSERYMRMTRILTKKDFMYHWSANIFMATAMIPIYLWAKGYVAGETVYDVQSSLGAEIQNSITGMDGAEQQAGADFQGALKKQVENLIGERNR